jgi:hypothetical protein
MSVLAIMAVSSVVVVTMAVTMTVIVVAMVVTMTVVMVVVIAVTMIVLVVPTGVLLFSMDLRMRGAFVLEPEFGDSVANYASQRTELLQRIPDSVFDIRGNGQ